MNSPKLICLSVSFYSPLNHPPTTTHVFSPPVTALNLNYIHLVPVLRCCPPTTIYITGISTTSCTGHLKPSSTTKAQIRPLLQSLHPPLNSYYYSTNLH